MNEDDHLCVCVCVSILMGDIMMTTIVLAAVTTGVVAMIKPAKPLASFTRFHRTIRNRISLCTIARMTTATSSKETSYRTLNEMNYGQTNEKPTAM